MKDHANGGMLSRLLCPVDLTRGEPWRVIIRYSLPIMLSYLLQQIYTLTDSIICGQVLSAEQVAGVNDTNPLTFIILQFAFGCTSGFGVLTAKCVGSGDERGVRRSFAAQLWLLGAIGVVLTVGSVLLLPWLLGVINVYPENPVVYRAAYDYCLVIFLGIFAQMGYNLVCGILRAYGDPVTPLLFLVVSTVLNIGLDLLLLVPLHMGPIGAAVATVTAQLISMLGCGAYMLIRYPTLRIRREDWRVTCYELFEHFKCGVPLGLQFSVLAIGLIAMQAQFVRFDLTADGTMVPGTPAQIGSAAANKLINLLMAPFNGLGSGLLGFNAQNLGSGRHDRVRTGTLSAIGIMLIISVACTAIGLLLSIGGAYQHIFLSEEKITADTIRFGNTLLYVDMLPYAVLGFLIVVRGGVQGVLRTGYVLGAGIVELLARVLICAFIPQLLAGGAVSASAPLASFAAVCASDPGAWLTASLLLLIPLFRDILRRSRTRTLE